MTRHRRSPVAIAATLGLMLPPVAEAQDLTAEAALARLFHEATVGTAWFAPRFLAHVPASQVQAIVDDLKRRYGALRGVGAEGDAFVVGLDRADVPARIALDDEGRIAGLWFEAPIATIGDIDAHVAAIAALPGQTSVLVLTDGAPRAAHQPDTALAVGSAAKLAILKAAADAVAAGRLRWEQVVPLDPSWRSLPTGILQDWPEGTPVTVATLANLMISVSDNTATDALLHLVGREAVEAASPRNTPFPSTRELFAIKADAELRAAWVAGSPADRRRLLGAVAGQPPPGMDDLPTAPTAAVEWFLSAVELCRLLDETADLSALRINPGLAERHAWAEVAFKGGSEEGVLNLSTRLVAQDGTIHCVVATWNDDAGLDEERLLAPCRAILRALRPASH